MVVGIIVGNFAGRVWQCNVAMGRGARGEWLSGLQQRGRCGVVRGQMGCRALRIREREKGRVGVERKGARSNKAERAWRHFGTNLGRMT